MLRAWASQTAISSWPAAEPHVPPTEYRRRGDLHFLSRSDVGGAEFRVDSPDILLIPANQGGELDQILATDWLPLIGSAWGHLVLHASGAVFPAKAAAVAFVGSGSNTVSWDPTIGFVLLVSQAAGLYQGTITHSVS